MEGHRSNYALSVLIAIAIRAEPLRCWRNAALTVLTFPTVFTGGAYVEGWIVIPRAHMVEIVEHGWCVSPSVGILDPSLVFIETRDQPVFYFPGFEFPGNNVSQSIAGKTIPLVCNTNYGSDGMGHHRYKQSYEQAWQQACEEAQERRLPQSAIKVSRHTIKHGLTHIADR